MIYKLTILHPKEKGKLMQTLIEASIFRKIKITHALVMDYDSLSEKEIASLNHCSLSTAKNDLVELQKEYSHIFGMEIEYGHVRFTKKKQSPDKQNY